MMQLTTPPPLSKTTARAAAVRSPLVVPHDAVTHPRMLALK